jgi:predicted permease
MAVSTLALGIGANTAIYSVMDAIMLRALPVRNPGELAILNWRAQRDPLVIDSHTGSEYNEPGGGKTSPDFPWPAYELLRDHNSVFTSLFAYQDLGQLTLSVRSHAELGRVELVSGNFFRGLGIVAAAGRLIDERRPRRRADASQLQLLAQRFAGDPAAIGQAVRINGRLFTLRRARRSSSVRPGAARVYAPIANRPAPPESTGTARHDAVNPRLYWANMMGRLRPGISQRERRLSWRRFPRFALDSAAKAERASLPELWLEEGGSGVDSLRRQYSKPLFVLMAMAALILAIACANIANMLLARGAARRREVAVRLSLGASRARVMRQLLTESVLLALTGGFRRGWRGGRIRFLIWLRPQRLYHAQLIGASSRSRLPLRTTGIAFGLAPALETTRVDITPALKAARRSVPRMRGRRPGLTQLLMVSQIALSLLLVIGAAFFVRTLSNLHSVTLGFNQERLLTFWLDASQAGYRGADLTTLYAGMDQQFQNLPGVRAATMSDVLLVSGGGYNTSPCAPAQDGPGGPSASNRRSDLSKPCRFRLSARRPAP